MAVEVATALVWALRILLPIILFCIYFKLQAPKDETYPGPTKNQHSRHKLLQQRKAVVDQGTPESMRNLTRVGPDVAPELFEKNLRSSRGRGGPREDRQQREDRGERRERREREPREQGERSSRRGPSEKTPATALPAERLAAAPVEAEPEESAPPAPSPAEEKMHLESLLNYVAFNRKEQQRTFLPDPEAPPPPPPKPPVKVVEAEGTLIPSLEIAANAVTGEAAAKANAEAQMVLGGAIKFKRVDVAKKLYEQLAEQQVEVSEKTFSLMIESCVLACDLKNASDFLMNMEAAGHSPDTELLDKVMDLYSQQKLRREQEQAATEDAAKTPLLFPRHDDPAAGFETSAGAAAAGSISPAVAADLGMMDDPVGGPSSFLPMPANHDAQCEGFGGADAQRTKLSSKSSLFVPTFVPPPPPPKPTLETAVANDETKADDPSALAGRTALKASSRPFQPQGTSAFTPYEYSWAQASEQEEQDRTKGKGGKGKGDGKGKDKRVEKENKKPKAHKEPDHTTTAGKWVKKDAASTP
mmetsp:Transcript_8034/g.19951  ORF Transcript_8034/g.19951 Transcript_8034/m.19951 type:complete len:529 (+) Transcript_8034:136-1722(+)